MVYLYSFKCYEFQKLKIRSIHRGMGKKRAVVKECPSRPCVPDSCDHEALRQVLTSVSECFGRGGWNRSGRNLLAAGVYLSSGAKASRKVLGWDTAAMVGVLPLLHVVDFGLLAVFTGKGDIGEVCVYSILLFAICYLWQRMKTIEVGALIPALNRKDQKILVLKLVDLCEKNKLDYEDLDDLASRIYGDNYFSEEIVSEVNNFVNQSTRYKINSRGLCWLNQREQEEKRELENFVKSS